MTPIEAYTLLGSPKTKGPVTFADILFAVEAWICACIARAESVQRFIDGGRVPRRVLSLYQPVEIDGKPFLCETCGSVTFREIGWRLHCSGCSAVYEGAGPITHAEENQ